MARRSRHSATIKRGGARRDAAGGRTVFHDLPAEWYWEQDAELRFSKVEVRNGAPAEQALAARILGKQRWETGIDIEGGWDAHRAALEARQPFRDVLMWRTFEDGSRRYLSVSGEPVFDAKGRFTGYRGVGRSGWSARHGNRASHCGSPIRSRTRAPSARVCPRKPGCAPRCCSPFAPAGGSRACSTSPRAASARRTSGCSSRSTSSPP